MPDSKIYCTVGVPAMADWREAYVRRAERAADERMPLTASQHILHLLLTVLTCGLWLPVWIIRAARGNPRPYQGETFRTGGYR